MPKNMIELGTSGLTQFGGYVDEEWLRALKGERGRRTIREMADNDALIGAILFAVEMLLRNVDWRVEPFDDSPDRKAEAEFVESLMDDMSHTWEDFIAEALSMLPFGWAAHEIVYKRRVGPEENDPTRRSRHMDGLIGWRKLPLRSQDTLDRWVFDGDGGIKGMIQQDPTAAGGKPVEIPIEKMLLFRTTSRKNNPEGRSILRNAYITYYHKSRIANYESIGVERDLAGLPLFYVPSNLTNPNASAAEKAQYEEFKNIARNLRTDEQGGLVLPSVFDDNNNRLLSLELIGTGSRRMHDTTKILERKNREMAMTILADFILLGHEKVGSFALSDSKTNLFSTALGAWLKELAAVLNRHGVSRLYRLNGWRPEEAARFVPGDIERKDLDKFSQALERLVNSGMITPGAEEDEEYVRDLADLPAVQRGEVREPAPNTGDEPAPDENDL